MVSLEGLMLLIAQPKSASTSLTRTIAKIGKLNYRLGIPRRSKDINCEGFEDMQRYHDNMIKRSELFLKQVVKGKKTIFKEHLLPIESHLNILSRFNDPIIILLRKPEDSADNYKRIGCKKLNLNNLVRNFKTFQNKYIEWAKNRKNVLIVYYEDLILNYKVVIKKILKHYNIKYRKIIPLLKVKFTGVGLKRLLRKINEYT
jgi:hypothetical protein